MTDEDIILLQLAAAAMRGKLPTGGSLEERVEFAMRYVRENQSNLLWMATRITDDLMIRAALAGVLEGGSEEDRDRIVRSLQPLKMLAAAASGVPVDWEQFAVTPDLVPILGLWHGTKEPAA